MRTKPNNPKKRLESISQSNRSSVPFLTGHGVSASSEYSFFHLAYGQIGAAAEVLEPKEGGFSKRFHIAFANFKGNHDPDQPADRSKAFILDYHDWLAAVALNGGEEEEEGNGTSPVVRRAGPIEPPVAARCAFCDDAAYLIFKTVIQAVSDFQDERSNAQKGLNKYWVQKLGYADTDLAKYANVIMRNHQYCESLTRMHRARMSHVRNQWSCYEAVYAVRIWLRQLEWHSALYKTALTAGEDEIVGLQSPTAVLSEAESLTRHLLVDNRGWHSLECFRASRLVRNKFTAHCVRLAFDLLADNNIVDIQSFPRSRGRALRTIRKRPWSRIESDSNGRRFLKRLRVNRDVQFNDNAAEAADSQMVLHCTIL